MKSYIMFLVAKIFSKCKDCYQLEIYKKYRKKYTIDQLFNFNGEGTLMYGDGKIIIKKNSYLGRFSLIQASQVTIYSNKLQNSIP